MPMSTSADVMTIARDGGELIYAAEAPLHVATVCRTVEDARGGLYSWWRIEAKIDARNDRIAAGDDLVVALHPYGNGWVQWIPFKTGSKKGGQERPHIAHRDLCGKEAIIRAIDALDHDYWEKGNYLTAAISEPEIPFAAVDRLRNVQRQAMFVFGACPGFRRCEAELIESRIVQQLLRATEADMVRFWSPKARLRDRPRLCDEVKAESLELMMLSIRQALAGPHREAEAWIGHAVTEKVDQVYRGHLNRRNRVVARSTRRLVAFDDRFALWDAGQCLDDFEDAEA
jgi:hypothetical protein